MSYKTKTREEENFVIETYLRPPFQRYFIDALVQQLAKYPMLTPQKLTMLAGASGIAVFIALICNMPKIASILLIFSGLCDILDGELARAKGCSSPLGAVLDIVTDRFVEWVIILGLYWVNPSERASLCLLMLGSILLCVTSFLVVSIFSENTTQKSFYYSPGLIERAEAFLFFFAMILLPQRFELLAWAFILLVLLTTVLRVLQFSKFH